MVSLICGIVCLSVHYDTYFCFLHCLEKTMGIDCFTNSDCTGDIIPANDTRDCCVGTDNGLSFLSGSVCTECVGM